VSVAEGAGSGIVTDNLIDESAAGAIVGHRWGAPAAEELLTAVEGARPRITLDRNRAG